MYITIRMTIKEIFLTLTIMNKTKISNNKIKLNNFTLIPYLLRIHLNMMTI